METLPCQSTVLSSLPSKLASHGHTFLSWFMEPLLLGRQVKNKPNPYLRALCRIGLSFLKLFLFLLEFVYGRQTAVELWSMGNALSEIHLWSARHSQESRFPRMSQ